MRAWVWWKQFLRRKVFELKPLDDGYGFVFEELDNGFTLNNELDMGFAL